jgi:hypothetical protein
MSRRGCSLPANASGFGPHRASISSRFGQAAPWLAEDWAAEHRQIVHRIGHTALMLSDDEDAWATAGRTLRAAGERLGGDAIFQAVRAHRHLPACPPFLARA